MGARIIELVGYRIAKLGFVGFVGFVGFGVFGIPKFGFIKIVAGERVGFRLVKHKIANLDSTNLASFGCIGLIKFGFIFFDSRGFIR